MDFLKQIVSEPSGQASSSRVCIMTIILIMLALIVRLTIVKSEFPTVPQSLVDLIEWVLMFLIGGNVLKNGVSTWGTVKGATDANTGTSNVNP